MKMMAWRSSVSTGIKKAAANVTTPRIPAHETNASSAGGKPGSLARQDSNHREGNTHSGRSTMTTTKITTDVSKTRPQDMLSFWVLVTTSCICRPIIKKTELSRMN